MKTHTHPHRKEVCLGLDLFSPDTEVSNIDVDLIPPGEDYVVFPMGTTLHGRPQQTLDGDGGIEAEYGDGEIYSEDTIH